MQRMSTEVGKMKRDMSVNEYLTENGRGEDEEKWRGKEQGEGGGDIRIGENKTKQVNSLRTKMYLSDLRTQFVPRSKHSASVIKTDKLMLYGEISTKLYLSDLKTRFVPRSKHSLLQF